MKNFKIALFATLSLIIAFMSTGQIMSATQQYFGSKGEVLYLSNKSNQILTVYQEQNVNTTGWTKYGYNATLKANATKVDSNSLNTLAGYLNNKDSLGNAGVTFGQDDYYDQVVYRNIDVVNIDINTGELIGRLSDPSYNFEWFGGEITLPAGTVLLSGRRLTAETKFTVDCYTYFPQMYISRYVIDNIQYISLAEKPFKNSIKVDPFYLATFEATMFNPDKTGAGIEGYGAVPRSYIAKHGNTVLVNGQMNYAVNYYNFVDTYGVKGWGTNQSNMQKWMDNLTKAWANSGLSADYRTVFGVQGENYKRQIVNLLYLVKYANNDAQNRVGGGNVNTAGLYNASGTTVTTANGTTLTTTGNSTYYYLEPEKSGGTIGVYNSSKKGTATYLVDDKGEYKLSWYNSSDTSSTGYDKAGMNYGYNYDDGGIYATQFLVKNLSNDGTNVSKRVLLDGYVGSNWYTSVFCLGLANPWGNVWEWLFGEAVIYNAETTQLFAYINYDDYDYTNSNWMLSSNGNGFASNDTKLTGWGYSALSYTLPTANNYYRYLGTSTGSTTSGIDGLIGMPSAGSTASSGASTGLCDYYYCSLNASAVFGVLLGGAVNNGGHAGPFFFAVYSGLSDTSILIGFRPSLIS